MLPAGSTEIDRGASQSVETLGVFRGDSRKALKEGSRRDFP